MPRCHLKAGETCEQVELESLYDIANQLLNFLEERGFTTELSTMRTESVSPLLNENVRPYYRDYIMNSLGEGYQSLHITFYDNIARCYVEVQIRTKAMDDYAEIGSANHLLYEKKQKSERSRRDELPLGGNKYFDDAYERGLLLQNLELSKVDVNMFAATNNSLINDGCGLYRGRLILPYEHLSQFQNDLVD